eukprot:329613_1
MCSLCWWLVALVISNVFGHDKMHNCIHDEISHKVSQQHVHYKAHPLESTHMDPDKRTLLDATTHEPIRIRPYYDPLLINSYTLSIDKITYIKSLVSTSIHYLEQFVNVIPIHGPLLINRCQRVFNHDTFTYGACPLSDYIEPLKCQYATIPDQHIAESWYYDPLTLKSEPYKPSGTGIADADLVIYVSYSSGDCAGDGSTLAWASICTLDQFGRPISGTINFCPGALDTKYWKFDVGVTLHEMMHILAMSNTLFPYFYNWDSHTFHGVQNVILAPSTSGLDNTYIVTDKVKQISQTHFGCDTLIGAPLENTGSKGTIGSHWESKYLQSELMCGTMYSAVLYLSDFTLALMEDTGWYVMDYDYSDTFTWGYHEGCAFFTADCISKSTTNTNFDQYWCTETADDGCSYDYSTVAQCMNQHSGVVPSQFKYYSDPSFAGPQSHDYCAFRTPDTHPMYTDYEQICWDLRGNTYSPSEAYPTVRFGIDSRCVEVDDGNAKSGHCFQHECIGWDAIHHRYNAIKMMINDGSEETMTCLRNQKSQWIESQSLSVHIKCPNVDAICGTTRKPFGCYWGQWSDTTDTCTCFVGYIGMDCSTQDVNRFAIEAAVATASNVVFTQYGTGICITNSMSAAVNGYYQFNTDYEGLPAYVDKTNVASKYLYYLRYYSQWNIGLSYGDLSIYAYCVQSLPLTQVIDISDCELWTIWDESRGWVYDFDLDVFHCTPTYAPSIDPTYNPTPDPTIHPTFDPTTHPTPDPTTHPTPDPTTHPTSNPTDQPTDFPTEIPTDFPTEIPSPDPTIDPTMSPTVSPTRNPSRDPTVDPTTQPTIHPTRHPTINPTFQPTDDPTSNPSEIPTSHPTVDPTFVPTKRDGFSYSTDNPSALHTEATTTMQPSIEPIVSPSFAPT